MTVLLSSPLRSFRQSTSTVSQLLLRRCLSTAGEAKIPIIDFNDFRAFKNREQTASEVVEALKTSGFMYVSGHGIPESDIKKSFDLSAKFFDLPLDYKNTLAWKDPRANRGYVAHGRERVTTSSSEDEIKQMREAAPDFKESLEIGRDDAIDGGEPRWKNEWPSNDKVKDFKKHFLTFFNQNHELHLEIMRAIAIGLKLEETFFDKKCDEMYHNMRLLNYPATEQSVFRGGTRAGAHHDYGTCTLLHQDPNLIGGLEVQDRLTGAFLPATPVPGTIVINVGDLLARWSNGVLRSTMHRVVAPPPSKVIKTDEGKEDIAVLPRRQSIAYFSNPNGDQVIDCLPTCIGDGKKFEPITTEAYIVGRLKATYN